MVVVVLSFWNLVVVWEICRVMILVDRSGLFLVIIRIILSILKVLIRCKRVVMIKIGIISGNLMWMICC